MVNPGKPNPTGICTHGTASREGSFDSITLVTAVLQFTQPRANSNAILNPNPSFLKDLSKRQVWILPQVCPFHSNSQNCQNQTI